MSRKYLFIGGPIDGQRRELTAANLAQSHMQIAVPIGPRPDLTAVSTPPVCHKSHFYRKERLCAEQNGPDRLVYVYESVRGTTIDALIDGYRPNQLWRILRELLGLYTEPDVALWLVAEHKQLGGRTPLETIRDDGPAGADKVEAVIEQLASGAYS